MDIDELLLGHHHIYITPSHQFYHKIDNLEPVHRNQLPVKELHPQLNPCLPVPQYICPEDVSLDENGININLMHNTTCFSYDKYRRWSQSPDKPC